MLYMCGRALADDTRGTVTSEVALRLLIYWGVIQTIN
jgi:hypothetical protein